MILTLHLQPLQAVLYGVLKPDNFIEGCTCAANIAAFTPSARDFSTTTEIYAHSFAARASMLNRRQNRKDLFRRRQEEDMHEFCPRGRTPCRIPGVDDGYEVRFPFLNFPASGLD